MRSEHRGRSAPRPMIPGRRRLVRAARQALWGLLQRRSRAPRLPRGLIRRRLSNFLARSVTPRLVAILRSAALSGAVAAALLAPGAARGESSPAVDLAAIARGEGGFAVRGEGQPVLRGAGALAAAGDVNGDGLQDFLAFGSFCDGIRCSPAPAYVVFGDGKSRSIELADVEAGRGGFAIHAGAAGDLAGAELARLGDANGDGLADIIVSAPGARAAYIVFGKADSAPLELSDVEEGRGGFTIRGEALDAHLTVAGAGDVNGDGLADGIIGAPLASPGGRASAGEAYIVFGKADGAAVDTAALEEGRGGLVIRGAAPGDRTGTSVSSAADVNGDGLADVVLGAPYASPGGSKSAGETYVVFGRSGSEPVELDEIEAGLGGFVVRGPLENAGSGYAVSSGGDVNGDGLADIVIGVPVGGYSGEAYVVFGKAAGAPVELSSVEAGRGGFAIQGSFLPVGTQVAGAGDVNGDGLDDALIGMFNWHQVYVVFGKTDGARVELPRIEENKAGFELRGIPGFQYLGTWLRGAGDLNSDGLDDILISVWTANERLPGDGYVVFGKRDSAPVEIQEVVRDRTGFAVRGVEDRDHSSPRVAAAGDVNGDGLADLLLGAEGETHVIFGKPGGPPVTLDEVAAGPGGFRIRAPVGRRLMGGIAGAGDVNGDGLADILLGAGGETYVVFGKPSDDGVDLAEVLAGSGGFAIRGGGNSGWSVSGAGDVNGDGLADLLVGAPLAAPQEKDEAGALYLIFGKPDGALVELSAVEAGQGGFAVHGISTGDRAGYSLAAAGDVNGDGVADLIVGAPHASPRSRRLAGESYVVFGKADGAAVELSNVRGGRGGIAIRGAEALAFSGSLVSGAGDVNGDGLADLLIASYAPEGVNFGGDFHVVFGTPSTTTIDLSDIRAGRGGFTIHGDETSSLVGSSLSAAGDLDGDGLADLLLGQGWSQPDGTVASMSYVVLGKSSGAPIELRDVQAGEGGFAIPGAQAEHTFRPSVAGAGDVDGDGLADDLVIASGLPEARYPDLSGAAYVIFGPLDGGAARFRRGAVRGDDTIAITDAIALLGHLFLGGEAPPCLDAADVDDSGSLNLSDAVALLGHLFLGAGAPPAPGPITCGPDPTEDDLGCASPPITCGP